MEALLKVGVGWGIYSQTVVDQSAVIMGAIDDIDLTKMEQWQKYINFLIKHPTTTVTFDLFIRTHGSFPSYPGFTQPPYIPPPPVLDAGGPVIAGSPYLVGVNRRPELFIPKQSGDVIPLDKLPTEVRNYYYGPVTLAVQEKEKPWQVL